MAVKATTNLLPQQYLGDPENLYLPFGIPFNIDKDTAQGMYAVSMSYLCR
jgi:hypothetical protein